MTLHWWMHWFWVTTLLVAVGSANTFAAPQSEELQHLTTDMIEPPAPSERQGRAMYFTKAPLNIAKPPTNQTDTNLTRTDVTNVNTTANNTTIDIVHPTIQWTQVNTNVTDIKNSSDLPIVTDSRNVSVIPVIANLTDAENTTIVIKKVNLTKQDFVKEDSADGVSESRIVTEKPLSLETAFVQTRIPPNIESSRMVVDHGDGGMDTGAIAGISFAALVLGALAGSTAFVLYRRRYLNKPQTLNDKCSNPDSSGYLDDSTIRDNSEEMYSLDNDSFLNSLEAMTIQNYWTDTVKHTKL
ncbi:uncharacterized protein LOC128677517 [Plodia interpunctella]|uniref:uncharacterized protein LOC128677517 n=1 Tax=Plodia interpunctella TaxID=58824 RepID=UPI002367B59F|nr:uncharacterized protein LOC128677517 [Plodia interpunctella]XP_053614416.1 uncharacterized protein LOC128677517 [Plodia interpunctella]